MGTSVFSTLPYRDFSLFSIFFFLFSFLRAHKKHKNTNKRISDFFPLRSFLCAFFIFVRLQRFTLLLGLLFVLLCFWCFWYFWCVLCVQNLFIKKKFKIALRTLFILLLSLFINSLYRRNGIAKNLYFIAKQILLK